MTENAPEEIELWVCEVCGKTDRYQHLAVGSYHFRDSGHRCDGDVVRLTYRRLADDLNDRTIGGTSGYASWPWVIV